jgi:tRNA modification GTPase
VIRVSGREATSVVDRIFVARSGGRLADAAGYTVHFGEIREPAASPPLSLQSIDEVLVTVFRSPNSYTGEDSVEISCHASPYIERRIMELLVAEGARMATPGEFTIRAFLAGKLDLSQAEAVADLIASEERAGHSLAMNQMRGGVSGALAGLRAELVALAALLELELDFGEEEVEFASRERLRGIAEGIAEEIDRLASSFSLGNAIRQGVPVAIVGRPNAGKSTLLNALVGDDRAMVSEIAGTTRDRIEERVAIGGVGFRFIDTAGLRDTEDVLERMGIDRTLDAVRRAFVVLLVVDSTSASSDDIETQIIELDLHPEQRLCVVFNKIDKVRTSAFADSEDNLLVLTNGIESASGSSGFSPNFIAISARTGQGLDELRRWLTSAVDAGSVQAGSAVVSSARHHEALTHAREAIERVLSGLSSGIPSDLLAEDIREVLHHLGTITGEVTTDEILGTIFSKFCIGK